MLLSASNSIPITSIDNVSYFSLNDFIDVLELKSDFIIDNNKAILYYKNHRIVLSGGSSYILINNDIYHLYHHVLYTKDDFYIPVFSFIDHIKKNQIPSGLNVIDLVITSKLLNSKSEVRRAIKNKGFILCAT